MEKQIKGATLLEELYRNDDRFKARARFCSK